MICLEDDIEDNDIAKMCQVETTAFIAWNKFGKKGGKAGGKGKKGQRNRPKFSAGMKPKLSLEERKKALEELKKKTKCLDCGELGHWAGDRVCKSPKKKHARLAVDGPVPVPAISDADARPTAKSSTEYYHIGDTECVEATYLSLIHI